MDGSRVIWKGVPCLNVKFLALCGARSAQLLRGSADVTPGKFWKSRCKMVHSPEFWDENLYLTEWRFFQLKKPMWSLKGFGGDTPENFVKSTCERGYFPAFWVHMTTPKLVDHFYYFKLLNFLIRSLLVYNKSVLNLFGLEKPSTHADSKCIRNYSIQYLCFSKKLHILV